MYAKSSTVDDSLKEMNVPHLVNLLIIIKIELNFVLIIGFLDNNSFIIKFNEAELYALFKTYNSCNFLYNKCLKFLIF